ncbi:hypothetical protein BKA64DRAFT_643500 [Cadophora sp. MPI-SDFR-AT-0126]|nr:hypothetical protein BKA64DRAFT_643500 [Leotiomycetes sp. MPI-SDFR-AT-0126]
MPEWLMGSNPARDDEFFCLLWEDVPFVWSSDRSGLSVLLTYGGIKGRRKNTRVGSTAIKRIEFFISPCRDAVNIIADPTWMPLQLAIERVAFDQNYEELLNSLEFILRQDPIVSRQPVFSRTPDNITKDVTFGDVKTKCTSALSGPLQHATQLDNLAVKDVSSRYLLRLEEGSMKFLRNSLHRVLSSPAVIAKKEYSIETCESWVVDQLIDSQLLVDFNELVQEVKGQMLIVRTSAGDSRYQLPASLDPSRQSPGANTWRGLEPGTGQKKPLTKLDNKEWASDVEVSNRSEVNSRLAEATSLPPVLAEFNDEDDEQRLLPAFRDAVDTIDDPVGLIMPGAVDGSEPCQEPADSVRKKRFILRTDLRDNLGGEQPYPLRELDPFSDHGKKAHENPTKLDRHIHIVSMRSIGTPRKIT